MEPPALADERVARAIREGRARAAAPYAGTKKAAAPLTWPDEGRQAPPRPRRRAARLVPLLTGAAACLAAVALWTARTPVDRVRETPSGADQIGRASCRERVCKQV